MTKWLPQIGFEVVMINIFNYNQCNHLLYIHFIIYFTSLKTLNIKHLTAELNYNSLTPLLTHPHAVYCDANYH